MNKIYDHEHKNEKLEYLEKAMELFMINPTGVDQSKNHVDRILEIAKKIENYIYSDMPIPVGLPDDKALEKRKAFLDSLDSTSCCGRGIENCNGSEETCTCQK
jgi:hypothetical protein